MIEKTNKLINEAKDEYKLLVASDELSNINNEYFVNSSYEGLGLIKKSASCCF